MARRKLDLANENQNTAMAVCGEDFGMYIRLYIVKEMNERGQGFAAEELMQIICRGDERKCLVGARKCAMVLWEIAFSGLLIFDAGAKKTIHYSLCYKQ